MINAGRPRRSLVPACVIALTAVLAAGCSVSADPEADTTDKPEVTVVTVGSWTFPAELHKAFERQTGIELVIRQVGDDTGELTDELVRTKADPLGDVAIGVDGTTAWRASREGVFEPYTSPEANQGQQRFSIDKQQRLSAVDVTDMCLNIDTEWFAARALPEPTSFEDLTDSRYRGLLVTPDPRTSSAGLAFLHATIARFGDRDWRTYWKELKANEVQVVDDVEQAYSTEFSGSSGKGDYPIVVAYASAPAASASAAASEESDDTDKTGRAGTKALLDAGMCYRNVRYAGVLDGAENPEQAGKLVDFLLTQQFQEKVPAAFGSYPTREGVELPDGWDELAPQPAEPRQLPAKEVSTHQERWLSEWRSIMRD